MLHATNKSDKNGCWVITTNSSRRFRIIREEMRSKRDCKLLSTKPPVLLKQQILKYDKGVKTRKHYSTESQRCFIMLIRLIYDEVASVLLMWTCSKENRNTLKL